MALLMHDSIEVVSAMWGTIFSGKYFAVVLPMDIAV